MYESTDKMVSHPEHYQSKSGLEVINVIKAFTADLKGIEATDTGNIIKYACRWKRKNGIQDLEKIIWYTQHLIDELKGSEQSDHLIVNFDEAVKLLKLCKNILNEYGRLTVADVLDIQGYTVSDEDRLSGWVDLTETYIKDTGRGYMLIFPPTITLNQAEENEKS